MSGLTSAATGGDDFNAGVGRDAVEGEVAADPAGATGIGGEGFAADDGRGRKRKMRDEEQIADNPAAALARIGEKGHVGKIVANGEVRRGDASNCARGRACSPGRDDRHDFVVHEIIAGGFVPLKRGHHGRVGAVRDGTADAGFLSFKLEPEMAMETGKIAGLGVVAENGLRRTMADGGKAKCSN